MVLAVVKHLAGILESLLCFRAKTNKFRCHSEKDRKQEVVDAATAAAVVSKTLVQFK